MASFDIFSFCTIFHWRDVCEYGNEPSASIKFVEFVGWRILASQKDLSSAELVNDFLKKIHYLQEKWQLHERNNNWTYANFVWPFF